MFKLHIFLRQHTPKRFKVELTISGHFGTRYRAIFCPITLVCIRRKAHPKLQETLRLSNKLQYAKKAANTNKHPSKTAKKNTAPKCEMLQLVPKKRIHPKPKRNISHVFHFDAFRRVFIKNYRWVFKLFCAILDQIREV